MTNTPDRPDQPAAILSHLLRGNERFYSGAALHPHQTADRRQAVAAAQQPLAAILTCVDSRVAPELVFDQGLGDLYVVRVAGGVATEAVVGSLELAVAALGVRLIVVLGHDLCAAVSAALWTVRPDIEQPHAFPAAWRAGWLASGAHAPGSLEALLSLIRPVLAGPSNPAIDTLSAAIDANTRHVVEQLKRSEVVAAPLASQALAVVGAHYSLATGQVSLVDP